MIRILIAAGAVLLYATAAFPADTPAPAMPAIVPLAADTMAAAKPFVYTPKESDVVIGKDNAPVTIVEYGSLSCPHCAHFYKNVMPDLTKKYIDKGKVKFVYRNYLRNLADLAGAKLIECVDPEQRHTFIKVLFDTQMKWIADSNVQGALQNIAALGGVDHARFESCMKEKSPQEEIVKSVGKEAADDYHVASTPTFFINNTLYKGDFEPASIGKAVDKILQKPAKN